MDSGSVNAGSKYSEQQRIILNETSMVAILADLGFDARRRANKLFVSPFRNENNASFKIDDARHVWYDHGAGMGGNTIQLVERLRGCSLEDALDYLHSFNPSITPASADEVRRREQEFRESSLKILSAGAFTRNFLTDYATKERFVAPSILMRYCREVTYKTERMARAFYGIGFPNSLGGWAVRNNLQEGLKKFSTIPSYYTYIDAGGRIRMDADASLANNLRFASEAFGSSVAEGMSPSSDTVIVLEGFFDYLSWMSWNRIDVPGMDAVILNSTAQAPKAMDFILGHDKVWLMLDNDPAGRRTTDYIKRMAVMKGEEEGRDVMVLDSSSAIDEGNDLAGMYAEACRKASRVEEGVGEEAFMQDDIYKGNGLK